MSFVLLIQLIENLWDLTIPSIYCPGGKSRKLNIKFSYVKRVDHGKFIIVYAEGNY
jgi:hypothetical protein